MIEDDEFADFEKHDNAREPSIKGGGAIGVLRLRFSGFRL